ncbi:MAG: hypothetical protein AABX47_09570 [Nanoarchaeota archaeon]
MDKRLYVIKYSDPGVDEPTYALYDQRGNSRVHFTSAETIHHFFNQGQLHHGMVHNARTPRRLVEQVAESFPGTPKIRFSEASLDEVMERT